MKRLIVFALALLIVATVGAREWTDHPMVGRYDDSSIRHQEVARFGEYTIATGPEATETVEGEVWMTLYDGPADSSTFGVYTTYRSFLESNGFEMLVSCRPGECPPGALEEVYQREPFADNGDYYFPAVFSQGSDDLAAYIAAKRSGDDVTLYVSIAIAAGWESYPQYRLDVVEVKPDAGSIASSGTTATEEREASGGADDGTASPAAPDTTEAPEREARPAGAAGFLSGNGSVRVNAGLATIMLIDPAIAGRIVVVDDGTTVTVQNEGFRNIWGPFAHAAWFPNENVGIGVSGMHLSSDLTFYRADVPYSSRYELEAVRGELVSRVAGDDYPAAVTVAFGIGVARARLAYSEGENAGVSDYAGEHTGVIAGAAVDLSVPIVGPVAISLGLDYTYVPFYGLELADRSNDGESITFIEGSLGGIAIRLGLSAGL